MESALDARDSAELSQMQEVLCRIEAGTFGLCIDCGSTIPLARLHAPPQAARSIACPEKGE